jgi:ribosomal protein S21
MLQDGSTVVVKNDNISEALKRFKRNLKAQNLFVELKKRKEYVKPSKIKRETLNIGKRRQKFKDLESQK